MKRVVIEFDENTYETVLLSITSMVQRGTKLITSQVLIDTDKHNHVLIDNSGSINFSKVEE